MIPWRSVARIALAVAANVSVVVIALYRHLLQELRRAGAAPPQQNAVEIRAAVDMWRYANRSTGCPTVADLLAGRELDQEAIAVDTWGHPFEIRCGDSRIVVISAGPDGRPDTPDDIRSP